MDHPKDEDDQELDNQWLWGQEQEWRRKSKPLSPQELLAVFPEAKVVIGKHLENYMSKRNTLLVRLGREIVAKRAKYSPESKWFAQMVVQFLSPTYGAIKELDLRIRELKRYSRPNKPQGKVPLGELVEKAKLVPIDRMALIHLKKVRKYGDKISASCPFHNERTPSFYLYLKTNTFHCFGCQANGDVITFVQKFYGYSFREAIRFLTNE